MKMVNIGGSRLFACAAVLLAAMALLGAGCGKAETKGPSAPVVEVIRVIQRDVPVYTEWTASVDGYVNATIRAQVQGYLISRDYNEGDFVRIGQTLFRIDPRPFQAALEQAKGRLAEDHARWENARANLDRIRPLVAERAVSKKDLDDAVGAEQSTYAAEVASKAAVDKAQLDLGFTRIVSPIDGVAGIAKAQLGDLVGPGSIEELAIVSSVDPAKVYVPVSEQEYLKYIQNGFARKMSLELLLADGSTHPYKGHFAFADRNIDIRTGTIRVAAFFSNPGNVLRPGQFARVRARTALKKSALLVAQRAVTELQGSYQVAVVGPDNKVDIRAVKAAERIDNLWVIDEGLRPGEQVVVEGLQKIRQGSTVIPKPFALSQPEASDAGKAGGQPPQASSPAKSAVW